MAHHHSPEEARSREAVVQQFSAADQQHRDAWLRIQDSLARTLDDLYVVCRGSDDASELVESTLQYLEQSMQDVRLLTTAAATSEPSSRSSTQRSPGCIAAYCSAGQPAAAAVAGSSSGSSSGSASKAQACSRLARSTAARSSELLRRDHTAATSSLQTSSSSGAPTMARPSSSGNPDGAGSADQEMLLRKLSSPDRLRRTPSQTKASADERQARAERLRERLADARLARLQEQFSKQQRRAAAAASKDAEEPGVEHSNIDKQHRSELLRAAHLHRIKAKAGDESRKVHEVSFINTLTNAGKKADLQQRLEEGEARRAEALAAILAKQQGAAANIREAAERRRQAEAARLAQLASKQRRKEEAQAKLEQERRAAAAAREEARAAARALAQQREAAQQQLATQLRERVNVRLKAAAQRRLHHLEMIRERAALGKDFERRDSFANSCVSGRQSPAAGHVLRNMAMAAGQAPEQQQQSTAQSELGSMPGSGVKASSLLQGQPRSKLSALAPCFCPADAAASITVRSSSQSSLPPLPPQQQQQSNAVAVAAAGRPSTRGTGRGMVAENSVSSFTTQSSSAAPGSPSTTAVPLPSEVLQQLRGNSQSIRAAGLTAAASSQRSTAKGARRRMAKARHKMSQPGCCFEEPEQAQQLAETHEAHQLLAAWAPHLAVLGLRAPHPPPPPSGTTAAAARGGALPSKASLGPAERVGLSEHSSMNSSATNSPRSSISSFAAAGLSTSTLSSTLACSPPAHSPAGHSSCCWPPSRSSSCCDCDSHHAAGARPRSTRNTASLEQQQEALAALVASACAHMGKQQELVRQMARRCGLLHRLCQQVLAACSDSSSSSSSSGGTSAAAPAPAEPSGSAARLHEALLLELLARLLDLPANLDYLLSCGELLPEFVRTTRSALDHCNSLDADAPGMMAGGTIAARLSTLLHVLVAVLEHVPCSRDLVGIQEQLVGFMTAAGLIGRLASVFSLFDQLMQQAAQPVPPHVLQCLRLLGGLTAARCSSNELLPGKQWPCVTPNAAAIVLEMQATSMAGVLSLLTAVLLQASPTCTPAEASCRALPPNFVEAAHLVMAVLNNVCRLDLLAGQHMLSCAHHRLEFYHLISFLLSYCLSRWPAPVPAAAVAPQQQQQEQQQLQKLQPSAGPPAATRAAAAATAAAAPAAGNQEQPLDAAAVAVVHHPVAQLLNQVLLLIGYFCVQHPSNQAMLTWGRSPSILQRLCSLPREYLEVPQLRGVLMPTMLCVCHGAARTSELVAQNFSLQQLLRYVEQEQQQAVPKPQAEQQQPEQQQPEQQQHDNTAGSSRRQRRRLRRAEAQQQQQQTQQQWHAGRPGDDMQLGQQLPTHAQEVLQQSQHRTPEADTLPGQQERSSWPGHRASSDDAGRGGWGLLDSGHQAVFALGRRFPLQSLPAAAEQLWQVVGRMQEHQQQQQPPRHRAAVQHFACQGKEHNQQPAARAVQQQPPQQQSQDCSGGAQLSGPDTAAGPTALQRAPPASAKACVVVCEVVACS